MRSGRSSHTDTREERRGEEGRERRRAKQKGKKGIEEEWIINGRTGEEMAFIHTLVLLMAVLKLNCRHAVSIFSLNVFYKIS